MNRKKGIILALLLAGSIWASGCAIGNYGSLLTRYTYTDTATVMDVYSLGLQVRDFQPDRGTTFGYRRSSYIFPRQNTQSTARQPDCWLGFSWGTSESQETNKWCLFQSPPVQEEMLTRISTTAGVEIQYNGGFNRLSLGYLDQALTIGPQPGESMVYKLDYTRNDPEKTYVFLKKYKKGETP